jgi:coenzyme F420-reducing hydrogenase delta subunit
MQYPANIRVIRVMCSGRIDPKIVMEALANGIDGVLVAGCHPGDCHYISGNYMAQYKIKETIRILKRLKIKPEFSKRLRLEWVSASEGQRFAQVVKEFVEQVRELGPNPSGRPIKDTLQRKFVRITTAQDMVASPRIRTLISKEKELVEDGNVYGEKKKEVDFDLLMEEIIDAEFIRNQILEVVKDTPMSVKEIAKIMNFPTDTILKHVLVLKKKALLIMTGVEGRSPLYMTSPLVPLAGRVQEEEQEVVE